MRSVWTKVAACGVAAAMLAAATPSTANVVYTLANTGTPTNSISGPAAGRVDLHAPITFQFELANALTPGIDSFLHDADVVSWIATGGQAQSTITSDTTLYPLSTLARLHLRVNAAGDITFWRIDAHAINPATNALHPLRLDFLFDNFGGLGEHLLYGSGPSNTTLGGAICTHVCGQAFSAETIIRGGGDGGNGGADAVPEPSEWALLLAGFTGIGAVLRRRSAATARPA